MKTGTVITALALCSILALGSTVFGGASTGPIPTYAKFRDNCRPTLSPRDCLFGLPETPDRVGGDFQGAYTEQSADAESIINRQGNYHLHTNAYGPSSFRRIWLDFSDGTGTRPFVGGYAEHASLTTAGTIPFYEMNVSTEKEPVRYVGNLEIHLGTETWNGMLLFDQVTITRVDKEVWTIEASGDDKAKLTDRDRQVLGTFTMPFLLTVRTLPEPHWSQKP